MAKQPHPASIYNEKRRIVFSSVRKKGFDTVYEWMKVYRNKKTLDARSYVGLMAELTFFESYGKEFQLTLSADCGEHSDFTGMYRGDLTRFDVTTNLDYKKFATYEPFFGDGPKYRIAVCDPESFELVDVYDLAFKQCECGGYLIPFIALLGESYDEDGVSNWTHEQASMTMCSQCIELDEHDRFSHPFMYQTQDITANFPDDMSLEAQTQEIDETNFAYYKYFQRSHGNDIMGVAEKGYIPTDPKGDGYWAYYFRFRNNLVSSLLPDDIPYELEIDFN